MYCVTKALVLRETQYKDNDKLLALLSAEHGLLLARARGVKRKNSKLRSGCQLLCFSEFTLYENKGFYSVNEVDAIEMFTGFRNDIELLSLGSYFCQVLETVATENEPAGELLQLGLNCLYALEKLNKPQLLVKAAFELRLLSLIGYRPDLSACNVCGRDDADRLWFRDGTLLCSGCSKLYGKGTSRSVSEQVLMAMRYILTCDSKRLLSFSLPDIQLNELADVCETYLLEQLEQGFTTLTFYKRLFP